MGSDGEMECSTQPPITELTHEHPDDPSRFYQTIGSQRITNATSNGNIRKQANSSANKISIAASAIDGGSPLASEKLNAVLGQHFMTKRPDL